MASTDTPTESTDADPAHTVVARLAVEFDDSISRSTISRVVAASVRDLAGVPAADIPELSERVARQRLLAALERAASWDRGGLLRTSG
ncbi:three-helix bundle dimerization domain-containing protein [Rhodococcus koreensis]|uniref:three-helix bundle dimerization domain-containing protein n=1 Tax=Rhodococcus koreensis TaxID=99653 RepID=UPI0036DD7D32